jgi:hypothetical protein
VWIALGVVVPFYREWERGVRATIMAGDYEWRLRPL